MSLVPNLSFANPSTPIFGPAPAYASFSSTQTQVVPAGIASPATFDTADIPSTAFSLPAPSSVRCGVSGVYKILASAQCDKSTGGAGDLEMFLQVNLTPVPNSATRLQINQNQESVMTVEWLVQLNAGDTVFVQFFSSTTGLQLLAVPATPTVPAIPSVIVTLVRIA